MPGWLARREFADHPRDGFRRPSAESAGGIRRRCVVFQDVAYDATTIERTRRDTTARRSRAEPASARPASEATRGARSARKDDQPSESADSNEPGRPIDDARRGLRAGGLAVCTTRTGSPRGSARCDAWRVGWRAACPPSTGFRLDVILARPTRGGPRARARDPRGDRLRAGQARAAVADREPNAVVAGGGDWHSVRRRGATRVSGRSSRYSYPLALRW